MPLFSVFELLDTYINRTVDAKLNEWKVKTYAENVFLHKIPDTRIEEKRAEIKRDVEAQVYFWRGWVSEEEKSKEEEESE